VTPPSNVTSNQSEAVTLTCTGSAREAPSVEWYKGKTGEVTLVSDQSDRVTVSVDGDLTIQVPWLTLLLIHKSLVFLYMWFSIY